MVQPTDCSKNTDPLKLVREGTSQDQRLSLALNPEYAPVDERTPAHRMVFARAYSAFLKYYEANNVAVGDWRPFFSEDVSARLAIAAVQDVEFYKANIKACFDFLNNDENKNKEPELKNNLGYLFNYLGTLARQLDGLKDGLTIEISLNGVLQNLIQSQLAPVFRRLIAYYKADLELLIADRLVAEVSSNIDIVILGITPVAFSNIYENGLSNDWITDGSADWNTYVTAIPEDKSVYGSGVIVFERINHIATHNLFTAIFDQFLKNYARVVNDAKLALEKTFTNWDRHEPHYALFLAFLRLFEYARTEANTLTQRHLDFYYREILRLKEKSSKPGHAHLLVELAKHVPTHLLEAGELFKVGKDDLGREAFFANDRDLVVNQAKVAALKTVYRHGNETVKGAAPTDKHFGRLFASPVTNSDDGLGAELTAVDQSWHPFYNKIYQDGTLSEINMPEAEVGFAIASHYLWMAEGKREITVEISVSGYAGNRYRDSKNSIVCLLTSEKGWIEKAPISFAPITAKKFKLKIEVGGGDAPITPYLAKTHGYTFETDLPVLLIKLKHDTANKYAYSVFKNIVVKGIKLEVAVENLKTFSVSNDFGPVNTSKPFQPYGASPRANNALIIGSKEIFQKKLVKASIEVKWLSAPKPYPHTRLVGVNIDLLRDGKWTPIPEVVYRWPYYFPLRVVGANEYSFTNNLNDAVVDRPDITSNEFYTTASRHGFIRLKLANSFGQDEYQEHLLRYLRKEAEATDPRSPPVGPTMAELWMNYTASQTITLDSLKDPDAFDRRKAQFFHLAPFGQAEQHPKLNSANKVFLFPQFDFRREGHNYESETEFYIGITGLKPPQNLSLLFQVIDGTAAPLVEKPDSHIHWSYLRANEWVAFSENEVEDLTGGLINSGIITFAMPREASDANTLLPPGMHWIRAAVASKSVAVCRLVLVAAQALRATFTDKVNDPAFSAKVLAKGAITKLDQPTAAIKKISQPFVTFGGQGMELPAAFYTRVSERLRHKGRAIALWDYERLVLEAFPQIYRVKCLNHTQYEPNESGTGIYREFAPGHVTIVTIPNQRFHEQRDPLRPYTSLGLLEQINVFLLKHVPCFVKLHVRNPRIEEVSVAFNVRLRDGSDELFHVNKLKEAITRFLSPWAFPGGGSPTFGGKIYQAVLLNFIEEQSYVDYVTDFQLFHYVVENGFTEKTLKIEVESKTAVSILVSAPANKHVITVIGASEAQTLRENCSCAP